MQENPDFQDQNNLQPKPLDQDNPVPSPQNQEEDILSSLDQKDEPEPALIQEEDIVSPVDQNTGTAPVFIQEDVNQSPIENKGETKPAFVQEDETPSTPLPEKEISTPSPEKGLSLSPVVENEDLSSLQENNDVALIALYITDEGLEEAKALLTAWVPDAPLSLIVATSQDSHVSYLEEHLSAHETFTLSVLSETIPLRAHHIYIQSPNTPFKIQDHTLTLNEDSQTEQIPGESLIASYGVTQRQKALVLFFTQSISDFSSLIKLLTSCYASIIHHSESKSLPSSPLNQPIRHLVDQSNSIRQVAIYTQRFVESFNPDVISELEKDPQSKSYVQHIISILSDHTSTAFSHINPRYVLLHVYQRMRVYGYNSIHQYIENLVFNQEEIERIATRISIKNAFFFNDLRSLRVIAKTIIPSLVKEKGPENIIRIWVPGCSTGEDVLSLSMLIHEHAESLQTSTKVELLGTENNSHFIEFARKPQYSAQGLAPIPNILKEKFFNADDGVYAYDASYLEQCQYSVASFTGEVPHKKIDIIYCKDVLSTLSIKAQKALLQQFKDALAPQGILVTGSNDTGTADLPLFVPVKNQPFIYKPIQATITQQDSPKSINLFKNQKDVAKVARKKDDKPQRSRSQSGLNGSIRQGNSINALHKDLLLQIQAPVSLMIRPDFTIVDHIGNVGRFIAWPNNGHTINMLDAFPKEVQEDLRFAVNQVLKSKVALKSRPIRTEYESIYREFRLQVHPINLDDSDGNLIQIIFLETDTSVAKNTTPSPQPEEKEKEKIRNEELERLKAELEEAQEKLQTTGELLKDSKELLKASKSREKQALEQASMASKKNSSTEYDKVARQNKDLKSTNTELLELNRDLVRRIEELRKNMNRKLKEIEAERAAAAAASANTSSKNTQDTSGLNKNLELLLPKRHEVRTALTSIIGFADLLSDRIVDKDNRELAKYISKSGHKLSENLAPLLTLDFPDSEVAQDTHEEESIEEEVVSSNRVLVVEDSDATRRLLTLVLSDKFECVVASDGSEAIAKAEKEVFKAVLLDIDLGKGPNGLDVLDHLRQKNYYRTVPFMAVTSMATPQDRSMLLRKGFDAFVPKPFQKGLLLSTLDKIIDGSAGIA